MLDDVELVRRAQEGDRKSFDELMRRFWPFVTSILWRLGIPEREIKDLAQDVWLRVWQGLPRMHAQEAFKAWLSRITRNVAFDWFNHKQPMVPMTDENGDFDERFDVAAEEPDAEAIYGSKEAVEEAFTRLLPEQRTILLLRYVDLKSLEEIRTFMSLPTIQAVEGRIDRAKKRLLRALHELSHPRGTGGHGHASE